MSTQRIIPNTLVASLTFFVFIFITFSPLSANELHLIKRIYIAKEPYPSDTEYFIKRENSMRSNLKTELTRAGFVVVESITESDAILAGEYGEEIVLDGEQPDPPKYYYRFQLVLSDKRIVWRTGFNIRTRNGEEWADTKASQKIVEKLRSKVEESRKKILKKGKT